MTGFRLAAVVAVVLLGVGGSAKAFNVMNNTTRDVYVTVRIYSPESTRPDYTPAGWLTKGWWKVSPGGVSEIPGGSGTCYARMTFDTIDGELIRPHNPHGDPISLLTHSRKFVFTKSVNGNGKYELQIDNKKHSGTYTVESAGELGCRVRSGFYPYPADTRFRVGGERPPTGTTRTVMHEFDYRVGPMQSTNINKVFTIPPGAVVVDYKLDVDSERRAITSWYRRTDGVVLDGLVYGENKPFGAGGRYKGRVTITFRY